MVIDYDYAIMQSTTTETMSILTHLIVPFLSPVLSLNKFIILLQIFKNMEK